MNKRTTKEIFKAELQHYKFQWQKFKINLKDKNYQKKFGFDLFYVSVQITLLFTWLTYIFIPVMRTLQNYESIPNFNHVIALSVAGFVCLSIWFIIGPLPNIITYPIGKLLGIIGKKNKPTMPKGWKKQ